MNRFRIGKMLGCLVALLLSMARCGPAESIVLLVTVNGVVPGSKSLEAIATLNGVPATAPYEETQNLGRFAVYLPRTMSSYGTLTLQLYALDDARCRLASGTASVTLDAEKTFYESSIDLLLQPRSCPPLLNKITPPVGSTAGGDTLVLEGENLDLTASVTVAGAPALVMGASGNSLSIKLPAKPGAFGQVDVVVRNHDGQQAVSRDLFAYYAGQFAFPEPSIWAGTAPSSVATGDFNGDQRADLAIVDQIGSVSVLLSNGSGGFATARNFAADQRPYAVAVGDFNHDQKLDLVVANRSSDNVSVLLGDGMGGFAAAKNFPSGSTPLSLAVGDFNGDKRLDLAVANQGDGSVSVLLGDGSGGFAAPRAFKEIDFSAIALVAGDFNGDQKLDVLLVDDVRNTVRLLLGDGTGNLDTGGGSNDRRFEVGANPQSAVVGDFNGDHKPDLAVANGDSPGSVSVLLGNGAGGFAAAMNFRVGRVASFVTIGDFNGDQKSDLAVTNSFDSNVSVLLGDGTGVFAPAQFFMAGKTPQSVAVGDFNGDRKVDLVVANSEGGNVSLLLGNGSGGFLTAPAFAALGSADAMAVGDANGD